MSTLPGPSMPGPSMPGPSIAAIADDVTGATDVATAFRGAGLAVRLVLGVPAESTVTDGDVVVIALKTRTIDPGEAVRQYLASVDWAQRRGFRRFYFKYCSTFDSSPAGNIGPVADALADRLDARLTVVTPATPVHGRTVYQGNLFVGDQLLSESPMRHHPLTPMTDANLLRVLGRQTDRTIVHLPHAVVTQGTAAITSALAGLRASGARYVVADAIDDDDLLQLGRSVADDVLTTGAAGLATGLAAALAERGLDTADPDRSSMRLSDYQNTAVLAGSCSARTLEQVERMRRNNPSHRLDAIALPDADDLATEALRWFDTLGTGSDAAPLIYSSMPADRLRAVQDALGVDAAAQLIESAMGQIAHALVDRGVNRLIVAGGETSGSVADALGIREVEVGAEAAPGVPWLFADAGHPLALLLKSGNFGEPELLVTASSVAS